VNVGGIRNDLQYDITMLYFTHKYNIVMFMSKVNLVLCGK